MAQPPGQTSTSRKRPWPGKPAGGQRSKSELARTGALVVLAVLITLFAVLNVKQVKVNWIFGSGHAPLILVIVGSLLGCIDLFCDGGEGVPAPVGVVPGDGFLQAFEVWADELGQGHEQREVGGGNVEE